MLFEVLADGWINVAVDVLVQRFEQFFALHISTVYPVQEY
jgi:hypothetical protein